MKSLPVAPPIFVLICSIIASAYTQDNQPQITGQNKPTVALPDASLIARVDKLFAPWDKPGSPGCALAIIRDGRIIRLINGLEAMKALLAPIKNSERQIKPRYEMIAKSSALWRLWRC